MTEAKKLKKLLKKEKKKYVFPWRGLTAWGLLFAFGFGVGSQLASMADNALAVFVSGKMYKLKNADTNARYYSADFNTEQEMLDYGKAVSKQVEAEGAILLKNENNALPLKSGAKISCFSTSSVNLVYGGTGSGAIDTSKADTLKSAFEKEGFLVNKALWDFYETGEASEYSRGKSGYLPKESAIYEAPWSLYSKDVLSSVEKYNDTAIIVLSRSGGEEWDLEHKKFNYLALDKTEQEMLENVCKLKEDGKIGSVVVLIKLEKAMH